MTDTTHISLDTIQHIWLTGIKGTGMTPIAQILCRRGKQVSGSDVPEDFFTKEVLDTLPVTIVTDFSATNINKDIDLLIYSNAYGSDHVEVKAAEDLDIPTISLPQMHEILMHNKKSLAIAGTHGKTTTTALLGYIMQQADLDPTVLVGAPVPQFDGSALVGGSEYVVLEACEYAHKFQYYSPKTLLLTNIEYDHPDVFTSRESYVDEFISLASKVPEYGFVVANIDDINVQKVIIKVKAEILTFGTVPSAEWRIEKNTTTSSPQSAQGFSIFHRGNLWAHGETQLVGQFNLSNILGAIVTAQKFGINQEVILRAVKRFRAPKRRFEYKGTTSQGAVVIDDFGHHPTELAVTFRALAEQYPDKKRIAVFHAHTFTRTQVLLSDFAHAFTDIDTALILDIYGSAREVVGGITTADLVDAIEAVSHNALHMPTQDEAYEWLEQHIDPQTVVITIGAGDVWELADRLVD